MGVDNLGLSSLLNVGTLIAAVAVAWGMNKQKNESQDEYINQHQKQLGKMWEWKDRYEKEAADRRIQIAQDISRLEGEMIAKSKENMEIMRRLERIDGNIQTMQHDLSQLKAEKRRVKDE